VYLRARWYAPGQGRFVSEDPFAGWATRPYSLHAYQYAYSNPVRWTDPSGRCVPEWVPGGEPGCTLRAGIGQGRLDWQGAGDYAWDVVEGVGLPGAMAVDAIAGTNGTQQILDDAGTGTYLGVAFTSVTTLGSMQSGGAISNAALRGQVWLTSGSRLAVGVGLVGLGLNAADEGVLWLRTLRGDCDAFGEWAALQQLGAADGLLPFGDVLAAGMLLPGRSGRIASLPQQGWLEFHEIAGGHTLTRHIDKTDAQLINRLQQQPNITGSSTFTDKTTAERVIAQVISQNRSALRRWLQSNDTRPLRLQYTGQDVIGRGITRHEFNAGTGVQSRTNARIILRKNLNGGYFVLTAFPE
jgi:hypothetical protein